MQCVQDQSWGSGQYSCGDGTGFKDHPKVDVEIHVAGIISRPQFQDVTDAEWEKVIHINLTVVFTMCSAIYPYFMEHGVGRIVKVASVADKIGGKYHISCNEVCPSLTKMLMTSALTEEMNQRIISMIPMRRRFLRRPALCLCWDN